MGRDHPTYEGRPPAQRILQITTDESFRSVLDETLDREGRLVDSVPSAEHALSAMASGDRYDCVVVDHSPTTVDAPTVVRRIRAVDEDLPVVVTAADGTEQLASDVVGAGATDYLVGPTDRDDWGELEERVESALPTARDRVAPTRSPAFHRTLAEDVLGGGGVALIVSDADGVVRWTNDAVGAFFGVDATAIVGGTRRRVVREELPSAVAAESKFVDRMLDPPDDGRQFLIRTETDGSSQWLDARTRRLDAGPFEGGRVDRFADVTPYVRSEYSLRELQRLMVSREESFSERLHEVLELGCDRLDLPYGFVTAIDDDTQTVLDSVGGHDLLEPGETAPLLETYCRRTLAADGLVSIPDAESAGWEHDPAYDRFGFGCYVGSPVLVDGDHYGTLCFAGLAPRDEAFADDEELLVEFASAWTGWELERVGRGGR